MMIFFTHVNWIMWFNSYISFSKHTGQADTGSGKLIPQFLINLVLTLLDSVFLPWLWVVKALYSSFLLLFNSSEFIQQTYPLIYCFKLIFLYESIYAMAIDKFLYLYTAGSFLEVFSTLGMKKFLYLTSTAIRKTLTSAHDDFTEKNEKV